MTNTLSFLFAALLISTSAVAAMPNEDKAAMNKYAPVKTQCVEAAKVINPETGSPVVGDKPWRACVYKYANSGNNVLYYFHGFTEHEKSWLEKPWETAVTRQWIDSGAKMPIVVTVKFNLTSIGNFWMLTEKKPKSNNVTGAYEILKEKIFPKVDFIIRNIMQIEPADNLLMGKSMGGFNAAQLYFKDQAMFKKAALICPMMAQVTMFDSKEARKAYEQRTGANGDFNMYLTAAGIFFNDKAEWAKHSPLDLARTQFSPESIPLYVANGTSDNFGFHEGNMLFVDIAESMGANVESHWYEGKEHCEVNVAPLVDFFVREELFELHWLNMHM